ncbi:MAG TPA: pyrroline-5-carboxylate reductase, partial [Spirochaetia bacterium]
MKRIGIIGFGVMGEAFAVGLSRKRPDVEIIAFDLKSERIAAARAAMGIEVARSAGDVFSAADVTILCVKPQDFLGFADTVRDSSRNRPVISIMAGRRIPLIAEALGTDQVARFMPNIAATRGAALIGVAFHQQATPQLRDDALAIAGALGTGLEIPEKLMSAITGVSGSGIAYVLQFTHALALGGVAAGFDYRTALAAAVATLEGAASLLTEGANPVELLSRVTSPAGTTIQGVRALEKGAFTATVMEA